MLVQAHKLIFWGAVSWLALAAAGCVLPGDDCSPASVPPVNVTATAGENGTATITWEISPFDSSEIQTVHAVVKYDTAGGAGEQCNTYDPNSETPGCARACDLSTDTACTVTGLKAGVAYSFTVITQSRRSNPGCGAGTAFARSESVTPSASVAP